MNIMIVANHFAVCSARYAAEAFTRLGHTVRHVGRPMGRDIWGTQVPQEYVWGPDNVGADFDADIWIVMDSDPAILDHYVTPLPNFKKPIIVWGVDNHVRDYRRPYFDHYFLAHKRVSVMDWNEVHYADKISWKTGSPEIVDSITAHNPDMTWLPCAYDPVRFPPSPIPWEQREYDVCMIGVMYPKRWELVNAMRAAGLKVLAGSGLVFDAYRDAYHNSRAALVSSFNGDLPIRLFEGAGMGCAVLCDEIGDLRDPQFQDVDTEIAQVYHTTDEAIAIARKNQAADYGQAMAEDSLWMAHAHTWDARAQVIIDWLSNSPEGKAQQ